MRKRIVGTLLLLVAASLAHAQSPLGVGTAEPSFDTSGFMGGLFNWINTHQQNFYRALTNALKAMREDPWALSGLVGLSFAYGIFHAAGPGHGKAVISSYMVANEVELRRGIAISFLSALLQGITAILLVGIAFFALRGSGITMTAATRAMELASFSLIAIFGAWLLVRKLWSLWKPPASALAGRTSTSPGSTMVSSEGYARTTRFQAIETTDHDRAGDGTYCEACGHAHAPDPRLLGGQKLSLSEAWSAIVAVGLRPCSGAILVMSFSLLNGLYVGGILSVLAISVGTAITVAILASVAVLVKGAALSLAGESSQNAKRIAAGFEIAGAAFILLIGLSLLGASLQT